ncbi:MAG: ATP-binding protein [Sphingobium sp.]
MTNFAPVSELKIGHVVEVSGSTAKVELFGAVAELTRTYAGRVYDIGQLGSIVKIHFGRRIIFGFVTLLRMRSQEIAEAGHPIPPDADQRVMEVDLFAEGNWSNKRGALRFQRGISTYPLPQQSVFILTQNETALLYSSAEKRPNDEPSPLIPFAKYIGSEGTICRANIDKMFSTHCAVLGSTGSGKSAAVAAVLHGVIEHRPVAYQEFHPRIIIIDPHGEYKQAFGEAATAYRAYNPMAGEDADAIQIDLPYWLMSADEFRSLIIGKTEFEATSQHNIVYKALTHARMVAAGLIYPAPASYGGGDPGDGLALDEPRPLAGMAELVGRFDRDKPRPFSLVEFENHILYAQAARIQSGVVAKVTDSDFSSKGFKSILDKVAVLRRDPRIRFLMSEWQPATALTLSQIIVQLVGNNIAGGLVSSIRIVDISGLPNEVAGPLAAMLARILFLYKLYQTQQERDRDPLLLVCEEAHRYVPDRGEAEYAAAQSAIRRIAREGRKYGFGLMLVSQRPADVDSTVISQCNTWIVLRLTNSADQQHVARFLPDGLVGMVRALPALAQQEALFVGEAAALPARVRIRDLAEAQLPRSASVSYVNGWLHARPTSAELDAITQRMAT